MLRSNRVPCTITVETWACTVSYFSVPTVRQFRPTFWGFGRPRFRALRPRRIIAQNARLFGPPSRRPFRAPTASAVYPRVRRFINHTSDWATPWCLAANRYRERGMRYGAGNRKDKIGSAAEVRPGRRGRRLRRLRRVASNRPSRVAARLFSQVVASRNNNIVVAARTQHHYSRVFRYNHTHVRSTRTTRVYNALYSHNVRVICVYRTIEKSCKTAFFFFF